MLKIIELLANIIVTTGGTRIYDSNFYRTLKRFFYFIIANLYRKRGVLISIGSFNIYSVPLHYRWFPVNYESDNLEYLRNMSLSQGIAVDVGAHFGIYTIILAKYFNLKVYSYEPTEYSHDILIRNVELNGVAENVTPVKKAVSRTNGRMRFAIQATDGSVANSLVDYKHSDEEKSFLEVETVSIDSINFDQPLVFLKIDAEGAEFDVLQGAENTIQRDRPLIMLGLHPTAIAVKGDSLVDIWNFIVEREYLVTERSVEVSMPDFTSRKHLFDVFLVPRDLGD